MRRAGHLSEEQPLAEVTELDLQAVHTPRLSGLDRLGLLLPSLEVRSPCSTHILSQRW